MSVKQKYLMGFDIGTQGSKGIIIDLEGNPAAYHYQPHDVIQKKPGWAEHDAKKDWWGGFVHLARHLFRESDLDPQQILAVGISGLFPCMLPLDRRGEPLRNAILYGIDTRAEEEIDILNDRIGEFRIKEITRSRLTSQSVGPKILWFQRKEPELFAKAEHYLSATGYLVFKLTGKTVIDHSTAKEMEPFYEWGTRSWNEEMCEAAGISPRHLPRIQEAYDPAGTVTSQAAEETGLREGTPVVTGTGDFLAELISMGGREGDTLLTYGSTMTLFHMSDEPVFVKSLATVIYPLDSSYLVGGGTASSGSITKWFRDEFAGKEKWLERTTQKDAYQQLSELADPISPGSGGLVVLPYFAGERSPLWDTKARGLIAGLTLSHTKAHLFRAILEGTCFSVRHHLEVLEEAGLTSRQLISTGGGIKNTLWTQIMSDVTGIPQQCFSNLLGAPAGSAYLAGLGAGVFKDMSAMRQRWIRDAWDVHPNEQNKAVYDQCYGLYKSLYPATSQQMHDLAKIEKEGSQEGRGKDTRV